jgi:hypothetical protein
VSARPDGSHARLAGPLRIAARTGLVAGALGTIPGVVNSWETVSAGGRSGIPWTIHLLAALTHAEAFFVAGFVLGLGLALLLARRAPDAGRGIPVAAGVGLVLFTVCGIVANVVLEPRSTGGRRGVPPPPASRAPG